MTPPSRSGVHRPPERGPRDKPVTTGYVVTHAPARTTVLLPDRRPAAAEIPSRRTACDLAGAGAGRMGHGQADGAHGDLAAARPADAAGPPQLELARIRHARRILAAAQSLQSARHIADGHAERARLRNLSGGGENLHRRRLGTQCA